MKKVTILPVPADSGETSYYAVAGDKKSVGKTAGEALDSLTIQLSNEDADTLVIVQNLRPDHFFDADQQKRLAELMTRWRTMRNQGLALPADEQAELEAFVEAELQASAERTAAVSDELAK